MADNIEWIADSAKAFSDTSAWQGGVVPTSGDNAIYTGQHVGDCTNLASGVGAPDNMQVRSGYSGNIGTVGDPLDVNVTHLDWAGSGTAHITSTLDTVISHGTGTLNLTVTQAGDEEFIACTSGITNIFGAMETLILARDTTGAVPTVTVDSTVTIGNEMYIGDGSLTLQPGVSVGIHQTGGTIKATNAGTYGFLDIAGGRCDIVVAGNVTINQCHVKGTLDLSSVDGTLTFSGVNTVLSRGFLNTDNGWDPTLGVNSVFLVAPGGRIKFFKQTITPWKL